MWFSCSSWMTSIGASYSSIGTDGVVCCLCEKSVIQLLSWTNKHPHKLFWWCAKWNVRIYARYWYMGLGWCCVLFYGFKLFLFDCRKLRTVDFWFGTMIWRNHWTKTLKVMVALELMWEMWVVELMWMWIICYHKWRSWSWRLQQMKKEFVCMRNKSWSWRRCWLKKKINLKKILKLLLN